MRGSLEFKAKNAARNRNLGNCSGLEHRSNLNFKGAATMRLSCIVVSVLIATSAFAQEQSDDVEVID